MVERAWYDVPFWHFWNPLSGIFGAMIFGAVFSAVTMGVPALVVFGLTNN